MKESKADYLIKRIQSKYSKARNTFIFVPSLSWRDAMFQRPQQMARALARRGALVFYVEPSHSWPVRFIEVESRLFICNTPADAFSVLPEAFLYVLPWNISLLGYFPNHRVIYDYLDDLSVFEGELAQIKKKHEDLLLHADIVIATAQRLYKEISSVRSDVLLVPNAVDFEHFSKPSPNPPLEMMPILERGRPIVGYHGALATWFDYGLLKAISRRRRDVSFVLIGPKHNAPESIGEVLEESNVYWLGAKSYNELPKYVRFFDVGMIPFLLNEVTHSTSPIKLFEYFASGKPVISSPMEELTKFPEVLIAENLEDWDNQINKALELSKEQQFIEKLQHVALMNTWDIRAEVILNRANTVVKKLRELPWYVRMRPKNPFLRLFLKGLKVLRTAGLRGFLRGVYFKFRSYSSVSYFKQRLQLLRFLEYLKDDYFLEDNSQVILYTDEKDLYPNYEPRRSLTQRCLTDFPSVSIISTCRNESKESIYNWLAAIKNQEVLPSEVVVVDASLEQNTTNMLEITARKLHLSVNIIRIPGATIAEGRNIAINAASSPIVASVDFGCMPRRKWLKNLIMPFCIDPETEVSAGWYCACNGRSQQSRFPGWPKLGEVFPQDFIPSSRSLAFTKEAWEKAGGYPEWLTMTGEDTYFALELKRLCTHWAFVPDAVVDWDAPRTWWELWKKAFYWNVGNGEFGFNAWLYRDILGRFVLGVSVLFVVVILLLQFEGAAAVGIAIGVAAVLFAVLAGISMARQGDPFYPVGVLGLRVAQTAGFLKGATRKKKVSWRRFEKTRAIFFVLSGVPIDDTGGGARCTQISLELLRRGYSVVYVNRYPKWEHQNAEVKIAHPNLLLYEFERFSWNDLANRLGPALETLQKFVLVELPIVDFVPLIEEVKRNGGVIAYDLLDDWDTSLGGDWYFESVEREVVEASDVLIATAPKLKRKLENISNRDVVLLPNAVNTRLFNPKRIYVRPSDLPARASWIITYVGALWGDWFDWNLLIKVALAYPDASVVVIGDYRGQCQNPPPNLLFLGLKPQVDLPPYLAYTDVAIIPWKVNSVTQATSPLKLYEYLSMHCPVVAPDIEPLRGIPGVFLAESEKDFVRLVIKARDCDLPVEEIDRFVFSNDWAHRTSQLIELMERARKERDGK